MIRHQLGVVVILVEAVVVGVCAGACATSPAPPAGTVAIAAPPGSTPTTYTALKRRPMPLGNAGQRIDLKADYPEAACQAGIAGELRVRFVVDEHGIPRRPTLVDTLGHGLDEQALALVRDRLRFAPALDLNDRAVASSIVWRFTFELPEGCGVPPR